MTALSDSQKTSVAADIMSQLSSARYVLPSNVDKATVLTIVGILDAAVEEAEIASINNLPASPAKTWIEAHTSVWREGLSMLAQARKELS